MERQPWERQKGETLKAFHAFTVYRDLGVERSLTNVKRKYDETGKKGSFGVFGVWSARYGWVERVKAYDDYIDRKKRAEREKAIVDMAERHAKLAVAFQQRVAERLMKFSPDELTPGNLARWLDVAVKLERLSRGEPTEIEEIDGQVTRLDEHKIHIVRELIGLPGAAERIKDGFRSRFGTGTGES